MPTWLKWIAWPSWFLLVFAASIYLTFPVSKLKSTIVDEGERVLGRDSPTKVGRHGVNPELRIGDLSLYRASGLTFERLHVQLASTNPDPGPIFDIDQLDVRVGLLSLLAGDREIVFSAELYEGTAEGVIVLDDKGVAQSVDVDIEGVKLDQMPVVIQKAGVPVTGTANLAVHLELGPEPQKSGKGDVVIDVQRLSLGPGEFKVPLLTGGLTIPLIDLGAFTGKIVFVDGKGTSEDLKLDGRDVNAEFDLNVSLLKILQGSRLSGDGSFEISKEFLDANSKFKTILEFPPQLKGAKDDAGRYHFTVRGTVTKPGGALSKDGGKSRGKKGRRRR